MKYLVFKIILLLTIFLSGCLKQPDEGTINIEKPIFSELPVMYQGCILKEGNKAIIHKQSTLDSVFSSDLIKQLPALQNIDFSKYDILAGADSYTRGISGFEHHLIQSANSIYTYRLYVYYDLTSRTGIFYYGMIIDKLPQGSNVIFDVDKIQ